MLDSPEATALVSVNRRADALRTAMRRGLVLAAVLGLFLLFPRIDPSGSLRGSAAVGQTAPAGSDAPAPEGKEGAAEPERVDESGEPEAVIPPGREDQLAEMLGRGATLAGDCQFAGGQIDRTTIKASYKCPGGEVAFELRHPSQAPSGSTQTARFAITRQSGSPPAGLEDALVSLIRSREAGFEWKWIGGPPRRSARVVVALVGGGLAALVALWFVVRRRRQPSTGG